MALRKVQTLGGSVPFVLRALHPGQEVDVMQGVGSLLPGIDDAMGGRQDDIGRNEGPRASAGPSVASDIDLADGLPGHAPGIHTHAVVLTDNARA